MRALIVGLLLGVPWIQASAHPSTAIVDACLRTESATRDVRYTSIDAGAFEVIEDEDAKKTATVLHYGKDTIGTWEKKRPMAFGLVFNGKETSLKRIIRLDKEHAPTAFNPYKAVWAL